MNVKQSTLALAIVAALPFAAQAAPKVAFTAPLAGSTISGDIYQNSRCEVKGSSDIRRVVFWLDGNIQLNTEGSAPWNCNVNTTRYNDGAHRLKAVAYDAQGASSATEISVNFGNGTGGTTTTPPSGYSGLPYSGTPIALPKTFAATEFDKGGQNVAYRDVTGGNQGGQLRTAEDVDIKATVDTQPVAPYDIVNFQTGEWLAYTVNVPQSGKYDIGARVASKYSSSTAFHIEVDGVDVTGPVTVNTGSWTGFQWLGKQGVDLAAGTRVVKIVSDKEYFGLNALRVLASAATTPTQPTEPQAPAYTGTPYSGTPIALPKAFSAAEFDKGGNNVAYRDVTPGNQGGQFRTAEDVDIRATVDTSPVGPHDIINFQTGEWLAYTVNAPQSGKYDIAVRAASKYSTSTAFHVEVDGKDVTGSIPVNTGSWTSFQWLGKQGIDLTAGKHVVKVVADKEYFGMNAVSVLATGGSQPTEPAQNQPPTVSFKAPTSGAQLSGLVNSTTCEVNANDDVKVARVEFSLGGTALPPKTAAPWQCAIDTTKFTNGGYQLKATAYDEAGKFSTAEIPVSVSNTVVTEPASGEKPASLLFWSGFDGGVTFSAPYDCYGNGCYQDMIGTDSLTGFAFPPKINGGRTRFQMISNANSAPTPSTIGNYMYNEIVTVPGRTGASTKALYSQIKQSGCCGTNPQGGGSTQDTFMMFPSTDVNELYYSAWIKLQDDLAPKLLSGDPWRSFFAIKSTDTDWRLELYAVDYARNGKPQLMVVTDSYAPTRKEFWRVYGDPVPIGRWFKYEIYMKRSTGSDGRVWVAIDGKVLADKWGANFGPNRSPINRIMTTLLYSGSSYPIYQWVDDMQLWTTFPTAKAGDPWYDGVYAPH